MCKMCDPLFTSRACILGGLYMQCCAKHLQTVQYHQPKPCSYHDSLSGGHTGFKQVLQHTVFIRRIAVATINFSLVGECSLVGVWLLIEDGFYLRVEHEAVHNDGRKKGRFTVVCGVHFRCDRQRSSVESNQVDFCNASARKNECPPLAIVATPI